MKEIIVHVRTVQEPGTGWAVIVCDEKRNRSYTAARNGWYLSRTRSYTGPTPSYFPSRDVARNHIHKYNRNNKGDYRMVGGLH